VAPPRIEALAAKGGATEDDAERLQLLARTYRRFHDEVEGRFADAATLLRAARERLGEARWLDGAEALIVDDLELEPLEWELLDALAARMPVRHLERERPPGLRSGSFAERASARLMPAAWR